MTLTWVFRVQVDGTYDHFESGRKEASVNQRKPTLLIALSGLLKASLNAESLLVSTISLQDLPKLQGPRDLLTYLLHYGLSHKATTQ